MGKQYQYSNDLALVSQMKSWIAINPSFGCIWDCVFCIQHKDQFFDTSDYKKVQKLKHQERYFTPEDVVAEIMVNPRITNKSPLTFYNFSDPFLPQNTSDLVKILEGLDEREFSPIVGLITRTNAPNPVLDSIANLKNIKPIIFVSYAGYKNRAIETAPNKKRLELMKKIHDRGIPTIQYLRPVVNEWIEDNQIERISQEVKGIIDGVVMSGLRLTPEITAKIKNRSLPVPKVKNHTNKYFPQDLQEQIVRAYKETAPVFRYTSCAVSSIYKHPDYNAHLDFLRQVGEEGSESICPLPCIPAQRKRCSNFCTGENKPTKEAVLRLQEKIGYNHAFDITKGGQVIFEANLPKEDLSFFRHNLSRHVDCNGKKHHFDQVYKEGENAE